MMIMLPQSQQERLATPPIKPGGQGRKRQGRPMQTLVSMHHYAHIYDSQLAAVYLLCGALPHKQYKAERQQSRSIHIIVHASELL
jgi:hypothetical protein